MGGSRGGLKWGSRLGQAVWLSLVTASLAFTLFETTVFAGLRE